MSKAVRRARAVRVAAVRTRFVRLYAAAAKGELRRPNYVHEYDLTDEQREAIGAALEDFLFDGFAGEVPYTNDIEVAYHQGFLLSASWLIFSATEAYELAEVFDRLKVDIHHDWWITDGWGEFHDTYGVKCEDCGSYSYGRPATLSGRVSDAEFPTQCVSCNAALPVQHRADVWESSTPGAFWATCSCGWDTDKTMGQRYAKGAVTRHLRAEEAKAEAERAEAGRGALVPA